MKVGPIFKYYSVPAWSMGPRRKSDLGNGVPGPGNYDWGGEAINVKNKDPAWGFGKQGRGTTMGNANPGPGTYDSATGRKITGGYLGDKGASDRRMNVPGPGTYDANSITMKQKNAPKYTMRARGHTGAPSDNPGPGHYDSNSQRLQRHSFSGKMYSKAARDAMSKSFTPGPGNYDPSSNTFSRKNGKFGNDKRDWQVSSSSPNVGPGLYESKSAFDDRKGWAMGKDARDIRYGNINPGPGNYDYNSSSFGNKGWKQGTESRDRIKMNQNPGPGNYDPRDNLFGNMYGKINPENKGGPGGPNNPGPGSYDADYTIGKKNDPRFGFGKEKKHDIDSWVPGPGTYDGNLLGSKGGIAIDKQDRNMRYGNMNPGPGSYDGNAELRYKYSSKWGFGREARDKPKDKNIIGPGDYDIPHTIPDVSGYNYPPREQRKIHL